MQPNAYFSTVAELTGVEDATLQFTTTADGLQAGKAYLVKPVQTIENIVAENVELKAVQTATATGGYSFQGVYEPTLIVEGDLFVAADNTLQPSNGEGKLKGFRGYVKVAESVTGVRASRFVIDGTTTGIIAADGRFMEDGNVYNINGQRVAKPAKGLYIVNGKKQLVK